MRKFIIRFLIISSGLIFFVVFINAQNLIKPSGNEEIARIADDYFSKNKFDKAMPYFINLLQIYPKDPMYNYYYGICLLETGPRTRLPHGLRSWRGPLVSPV